MFASFFSGRSGKGRNKRLWGLTQHEGRRSYMLEQENVVKRKEEGGE